MRIISDIEMLQAELDAWRKAGETIAFVPTMGNLHEGHLRLVDEARRQADRCVVSIFVNPTQFAPNEDFQQYPRTVEQDTDLLRERHADVLFVPPVSVVYPQGEGIDQDCVPPVSLTAILCGLSRPNHFAGVATVVKRLFALVRPDVAVFGEKDLQQLHVIRWLVTAHKLPIRIVAVATVREASGLAMSSRNRYLNAKQRQQAAALYACLQSVCEQLRAAAEKSAVDFTALCASAEAQLRSAGLEPEYVAIRAVADLGEADGAQAWVVLAAARLGEARLIDNLRCQGGV